MIITEENIFLHIPKTAGRSIVNMYCEKHELERRELVLNNHITGKALRDAHIKASEVKEQIGPEAYAKAFKFTIVRNPLDKLVSHYHYGLRSLKKNVFRSFEEFVLYVVGEIDRNGGQGWANAKVLQCEYIDAEVDFVCKFENLAQGWKVISKRLDLPKEMIKANKSKHKPFTEYYTKELEDKVRTHFAKDFVKFEYT